MFLAAYFIIKTVNFNLILVSIITSIFCQLGDLFFSFLKRKAKIKDTGNFFPGHGGVLDRIEEFFWFSNRLYLIYFIYIMKKIITLVLLAQ